MSGTWPTSPRPQAVLIESFEPSQISTAQSLKRWARSRGGHRWVVKLRYGPLLRSEWEPLDAFAQMQHGQYEKFSIVVAGAPEAQRGTMAGVPLVNGAHAAGVSSIATDGYTPSAPNVFKSGAYIKFAGHAKVYRVYGDLNASVGGAVTLPIWPALIAGVADNEAITYANVPMQCALVSDRTGVEYQAALIARDGMEYQMIEDPYS